jgi:cysteine synthase A
MAKVAKHITELIGHTPLLELSNYEKEMGLEAHVIAKLEYFNPLGSVKDRVACAMIEDGIKNGTINSETVIIEPTSGNTGIGLAGVCASKGLQLILTMPDTMSVERRKIVTALGAKVVLTQGRLGMKGAIAKAEELKIEYGNAFIPQQFENPSNPAIHEVTTAKEIIKDLDGNVDIFIASVGTGGTITGTARGLKANNINVQVIAVEPASSAVLSGGKPGPHKIQGIGAGFIPKVMDISVVDEIITIENEEAFDATRKVAATDGLLVGISSGAVISAAFKVAQRPENKGKNIVVLLPDTGERYLSTSLFEF